MDSSCVVGVSWLPPEDGGRDAPVSKGRYTPTARIAGEQEHFSVVLEFDNATTARLKLLNPALAQFEQRVGPGTKLEIMEGPRLVAYCQVQNPAQIEPRAVFGAGNQLPSQKAANK